MTRLLSRAALSWFEIQVRNAGTVRIDGASNLARAIQVSGAVTFEQQRKQASDIPDLFEVARALPRFHIAAPRNSPA